MSLSRPVWVIWLQTLEDGVSCDVAYIDNLQNFVKHSMTCQYWHCKGTLTDNVKNLAQNYHSCIVVAKFCTLNSFQYVAEICEPRHDKTNKMTVRPVNTQISLGIRPVWSASSLCTQRVAKDPSFLHADSDDSDKTGQMPRLIWVFAGRTVTLLV